MKKTNLFTLALAAALALSLTACGNKDASSSQTGSGVSSGAEVSSGVSGGSGPNATVQGNPFADMKTVDLEGNEVDSSIFADNKLTLVNVWNLGCTPCVQEIPHLDKLNDDLAQQGVAVVGLYHTFGNDLTDQERKDINELLTETGADYLQLLTSNELLKFDELANIQNFPTTYFVDSEGNIVDMTEGSRDYEGWKSVIEDVLIKVKTNG